jgi:hypothetical protein
MSEKHFMFADFVDEFAVNFTAHMATKGHYTDAGKWVEGSTTPQPMSGIILPLSNDELRFEANGKYTAQDRKIYVVEPLQMGQKIECDGQTYTIDGSKPYEAYADVYIYFAKGVKQ